MFERKDKGCRAKVLADNGTTVLIAAFWPARKMDERRFFITNDGMARNTLNLPKADFERRFRPV